MPSMTDGELIRLYATEHSGAAFRDLVARHVDLVHSAALRQVRGQSHLADDVSQLVFIELARQAPRLTAHPSIRGWLFVCTRHIAAKTLLRESRRLVREGTAQAMNDLISVSRREREDIRSVLDEILCRLRDEDREALFLRFVDKNSFAELGVHLGISEDAARRRLDRVIDRLRKMLVQRGVASTAAALGAVLATDTVNAAPHGLAPSIAQVALGAASTAPSGIFAALAVMKTIALCTTFIVLLALSGVLAGGVGIYYRGQLAGDDSAIRARAGAVASAKARLSQIKASLAGSKSAAGTNAKTMPAQPSLEDQVSRDLELNRWKEQRDVAKDVLKFGAFLMQHGVTVAQIQQLAAVARSTFKSFDDLSEVARLAGVEIQSDPDLLAQARQLEAQYNASIAAILDPATLSSLNAYSASLDGPDVHSVRTGLANWVAEQVAGVAFAEGTPLPATQKAQLTQLLVKYTPNYPTWENASYSTLDWAGILAEAQQTAPAPEFAALQSFHSASVVWTLKAQAQLAAKGAQ